MRDYKKETEERVAFIKELVEKSHSRGIVFGNSGGKDCALVGILSKMACENTVSVMMPCGSSVNFGKDLEDAKALCEKFGIEKFYALDGGQTGAIALNDKQINTPLRGMQRRVTDVIYFATAVPYIGLG